MRAKIYTSDDFEKMRASGRLVAIILDYIADFVKPGVTTNYLNEICHQYMLDHNAIPAPLTKGFPKAICTSVNHVICHGIPNDRALSDGDILKIDVSLSLDGWFGDSCRTYFVGKPSIKGKKLVEVTYNSMMAGIEQVKPGNTLGDVGFAIQKCAESAKFSVVRDYAGHGIGKKLHDDPSVLNYGKPNTGLVLEEGMFFTIEPMINAGGHETLLSNIDKWTVTTRDKSLSAQFEHTIGVTANGCEIFTLSPKGMHKPPYE